MKKIIIVIICLVLIVPIIVFTLNNDTKVIKKYIDETTLYLNENEIKDNLFSNVLQSKLDNSLVYSLSKEETLIIYKNKNYIYKDYKLNKINNFDYAITNNIEEAFNYEIGAKILTKGFYNENDGGNAYFTLSEYSETNDELIISNKEKTKSLIFCDFNSVINVKQMGYNKENLDYYVNLFIKNLKYENIYIPSGEYIVIDNFDVNVSNKSFFGYDALIYSDDTYTPEGYNNGCLFYVYNNIKDIEINGFKVNIKINNKLDDPLLGLLSLRDVDGLIINNCSFYLPHEGNIYSSSGMIDLFTGWKNIVIKNCNLENHASTVAGGGIGIRDIYKKGCENALIENNYIYSNCKDEVIAVFSGGDTSLYPNETGGGYIKNVIFQNNKIVGDKVDSNLSPRVVGITVGYQLSPVYNINFINNDIEMYSANYLLLYGKADTVNFINNNVKIDASFQENLYIIFCHNKNADAGETITINNNYFTLINNSSIYTIASTGEEFKFINNKIIGSTIYRVFDSKSLFENNYIEVETISKAVYHNVKETNNNKINCKYLTIVFEFYNLNVTDDILIQDTINTETISANFMMFNGDSIYFNNHNITFKNFKFHTDNVEAKYYYLAYDTSSIKDFVTIEFINCELSIYENSYVAKDQENKVTIKYL